MDAFAHEEIVTQDGYRLVGRVFRPKGNARALALIAPAMGVSQNYYAPFARWLASHGFWVLTFDYRGMGLSRQGSLRNLRVDILDWGRVDATAALEALEKKSPGLPLFWIGHSLGGQILPLLKDRSRIRKIVTIATGSGYWRENAPALKRRVWWLWYFVVPIALPIFGYFPGKRLKKVGDLPYGVMKQWRKWCLDPEYAVGVEGPELRAKFAEVRTPMTSISFTDDELMSARNVESIHSFYTNAPRKMVRIDPREVGAKRIGHFGCFSEKFRETLWNSRILPEIEI